jgi:hypothetical protein
MTGSKSRHQPAHDLTSKKLILSLKFAVANIAPGQNAPVIAAKENGNTRAPSICSSFMVLARIAVVRRLLKTIKINQTKFLLTRVHWFKILPKKTVLQSLRTSLRLLEYHLIA